MQTMQQRRAQFALRAVRRAENDPRIDNDEYKRYAAGLPAMIHINGLGQTLAFYRSKGGTHERLYNLLTDWLTHPGQPYEKAPDLLDALCTGDMHLYRLAQAESQAFVTWVVKFAKAYMTTEQHP